MNVNSLSKSCDTNILFYSVNPAAEEHERARVYIEQVSNDKNFVISELVLIELYVLLRSPKILDKPLSAKDAVRICQEYRNNPN
jgi:predicted nucleic acid-binding protein